MTKATHKKTIIDVKRSTSGAFLIALSDKKAMMATDKRGAKTKNVS